MKGGKPCPLASSIGCWKNLRELQGMGQAFGNCRLALMDIESPVAPDADEPLVLQKVIAAFREARWKGFIRITASPDDAFSTLKRQVLMVRACMKAPQRTLSQGKVELPLRSDDIADTWKLLDPRKDAGKVSR